MRLAVTGGSGLVGRFIVEAALAAGWRVTVYGRRAPVPGLFRAPVAFRPLDLADTAQVDLSGHDALVHAAFDHLPGRYRGGEGDDPEGFARRNLAGSVALFAAARRTGVRRTVFLSSRAVLGGYPPGTGLTEDLPPRPDTLYGRVKAEAEQALAAMCGPDHAGCSLRATGVYGPAGPGLAHKWSELFTDFLSGAPVAPRRGTEVHGADLADAVLRLLHAQDMPRGPVHVSDLLLDRHDLLAEVARLTGCRHALPQRAGRRVSVLDCATLRAMGWRPGGWERLRATLPELLESVAATRPVPRDSTVPGSDTTG